MRHAYAFLYDDMLDLYQKDLENELANMAENEAENSTDDDGFKIKIMSLKLMKKYGLIPGPLGLPIPDPALGALAPIIPGYVPPPPVPQKVPPPSQPVPPPS